MKPVIFLMMIASISLAGDVLPRVYDRDGNIYMKGQDGQEVQITASGKDSHAALSPNGKQIVFVRQVQELKDNPLGVPEDDAAMMYASWSPCEIWTVDIKDKPKILRKSTYEKDPKKSTGWFYDLNFSPDGKTIYYACQPGSPTTGAIHSMNSDGSSDHWVCWGQSVDIVGDKSDKYYGHLVVKRKADDGAYDISVLMTPNGKEIEKISEEEFWKTHQKVK